MRATLTISAVLVVLITLAGATFTVKAPPQAQALSHAGYFDSFGYYHVVGEVQNVGDETLNSVTVEATFFDSTSAFIDNRFEQTILNVIPIGKKSPFEIVLQNMTQSGQVDHYGLNVTFSTRNPLPEGLKITSHSSHFDEMQRLHIVGEIKNTGTIAARNVKVVATCHALSGDVSAVAFTYLDPEMRVILDPNQTYPFELVLDEERTPLVGTYELTAESIEYAYVSEAQTLTADINEDRIVDIYDAILLARAFNSIMGDPEWNPNADIKGDGVIDIYDAIILALNFGNSL